MRVRKKIGSWSCRWVEVSLIPIEIELLKLAWYKNSPGRGVDLLSLFLTVDSISVLRNLSCWRVPQRLNLGSGLSNYDNGGLLGFTRGPAGKTLDVFTAWPLACLPVVATCPGKILGFFLHDMLSHSSACTLSCLKSTPTLCDT